MEVEGDTDCKKNLDEQKKSLQKQLRDIEKVYGHGADGPG